MLRHVNGKTTVVPVHGAIGAGLLATLEERRKGGKSTALLIERD